MSADDYLPLDLSVYCNAGVDALGGDPTGVPVGEQLFHGLPFRIGPAERAIILFSDKTVSIPINQLARRVVVAHRQLDSRLLQGGPVGKTVATYAFQLANGTQHEVPIRERFEIADINAWGQLPFLAHSDQKDGLRERWSGPWDGVGYRQTDSNRGSPRAYYLWYWTNPDPDVAIDRLEVVPSSDARFVIAAITLGLTDEEPFARNGMLPVRIELKDTTLAKRPFRSSEPEVSVAVDRGIASYVYPLPQMTSQQFLNDGFAGWGEAQNQESSPLYVQVSGIPSATLAVNIGDEPVDSVRWGQIVNGPVETDRLRVQIVEDGRNWVETSVVDDATGRPIPCRVHFRSADGVPYQPHGHHNHVNSNLDTWHVDVGGDLRLGQISYAYIDGHCQGWLPRGDVTVDVARGYEYEPLRQRVHIEPGQRQLTLRLRRWTDMNARRWFSGDTHVHFLSTQGSLFEAAAEDLNVVNLLQSQWGSLFTNTEDFTGEPVTSKDGRTVVWTNQENRQHLMGHMILLGLRQPVYPWCSDGPDEAELGGTMETTLAAWADACHAQGGTVILPHFPNPNGEPAALVATRRVDAVEMIMCAEYNHREYYRYLNAGYRLPLVGGTDKMSSQVAVGQYRTYVRIPADEEFTYESWCRNLRLGRTFHSGGPLLELSVDGLEIGDTLQLPAGGGTVEVQATARSVLPVHTLQIVVNGEVVAQTDELAGSRSLQLSTHLPVDRNSWICARVGGPNYAPIAHHDTWSRGVFAHTSPIYVACGGEWSMADPAGLQYMLTLVGGSLEYIRQQSPQRPPNSVTHHHGEPDHLAYLERPFLQAREALLHLLGK
jgi:hypothetical protein